MHGGAAAERIRLNFGDCCFRLKGAARGLPRRGLPEDVDVLQDAYRQRAGLHRRRVVGLSLTPLSLTRFRRSTRTCVAAAQRQRRQECSFARTGALSNVGPRRASRISNPRHRRLLEDGAERRSDGPHELHRHDRIGAGPAFHRGVARADRSGGLLVLEIEEAQPPGILGIEHGAEGHRNRRGSQVLPVGDVTCITSASAALISWANVGRGGSRR